MVLFNDVSFKEMNMNPREINELSQCYTSHTWCSCHLNIVLWTPCSSLYHTMYFLDIDVLMVSDRITVSCYGYPSLHF